MSNPDKEEQRFVWCPTCDMMTRCRVLNQCAKSVLSSTAATGETPRTDKIAKSIGNFMPFDSVALYYNALLTLCRQLERELAEARAEERAQFSWRTHWEQVAKASPSAIGTPFGWYDHFNDVLYRDLAQANRAEDGGNKITPLYEHLARVPETATKDAEDAARYRKLKHLPKSVLYQIVEATAWPSRYGGESLDTAIDSARKEKT